MFCLLFTKTFPRIGRNITCFRRITQTETRRCFTLHNPDWYSRDEPLGLLLLYFDLRNCDEAEPTFYIRHRFYRWVPNPNCHVLFTPFSSFLRSTSALYRTSSVILRAAQFRGGSVIYRGRVFSPPHCWLKMTFMGHPDKAILPAAQTGSVKKIFLFMSIHFILRLGHPSLNHSLGTSETGRAVFNTCSLASSGDLSECRLRLITKFIASLTLEN